MKLLTKMRSKRILLHLLFWVVVWFFYVFFFSYNSSDTYFVTWFSTFLLPLTMLVAYFMVYYLIPKFLLTKSYFLFSLYTFYTLIFTSYIIVLIIYGFLVLLLNFNITGMPPLSKNFYFIFILVILVVGIICFASILNHSFSTASQNKELQNKILDTQLQLKNQELHYLKMQIHPHFLFNTLNTIYGLALKHSEQTPEIILKLSNLLDYILYQVNKPFICLRDEALHIEEYIDLERIRFKDTLRVSFKADEIREDIQIAPMLLIPFVENAFKHGTLVDGFLWIDISIEITGNQLAFTIKNTFINDEQPDKDENRGIGLENIRKRLDLNYPNNYKLNQSVKGNWYIAELMLRLE